MGGDSIIQQVLRIAFEMDEHSISNAQAVAGRVRQAISSAVGVVGISLSANGIKNFVQQCVGEASDFQEVQEKFDTVYGFLRQDAETWAQDWADRSQRSVYDVKKYMADIQNLFVGFTDYSDEARIQMAELTEEAVTTAMNLASFSNLDETRAIDLMTKSMMGETECAKTLGAVLNETTLAQAQASLGMEGKFKELSEAEKIQVRLQAIKNQSQDALRDGGDILKSTARYEGQTRSLSAALKDMRVQIGNYLLPVFHAWTRAKTTAVNKLRDLVVWITEFLDTCGTAVQVVATLGGAILAALAIMNAGKVIGFIGKLTQLGGAFLFARLRALVLMAGILMVALVIEDFVAFLQGRNSVIGEFLKSAGVDVDAVRQKFYDAGNTIKGIFAPIWEWACNTLKAVAEGASEFWNEHGGEIVQEVSAVVDWLGTHLVSASGEASDAFSDFWQRLTGNAPPTAGSVAGFLQKIHEWLVNAAPTFVSICTTIWNVLSGLASLIGSFVIGVVRAGSGLIKGIVKIGDAVFKGFGMISTAFRNGSGEASGSESVFVSVCQGIGGAVETLGGLIGGLANIIGSVLYGAIMAVSTIMGIFAGVIGLVAGFLRDHEGAVILLVAALGALAAIMVVANAESIKNAAVTKMQTIWETIKAKTTALQTAATKIATAIQTAYNFVMTAGNLQLVLIVAAIGAVIAVIGFLINKFGGVKEAFDAVCDAVKRFVGGIKDFFGGLFGLSKDAGKDISDGIAEGLDEGAAGVAEAAGNVADAAGTELQGAGLQETGYQAGTEATAGVAQGMSDTIPAVEQQAAVVGQSANSSMAGAAEQTATEAIGTLFGTGSPLSDTVTTGMEGVVTEGVTGMDPSAISSAFGGAVDSMDLGALSESISGAMGGTDTSVTGAGMTDAMSGAFDSVDTSALSGDISEMFSQAAAGFDATGAEGGADLSGLTGAGGFSVGGGSQEIVTALQTLQQAVTAPLQAISEQVLAMGQSSTAVVQALAEARQGIADQVALYGDSIMSHMDGMVSQLGPLISRPASEVRSAVNDVRVAVDGARSGIATIGTAVVKFNTQVVSLLQNKDTVLTSKVTEIASNVAAISPQLTSITTEIQRIAAETSRVSSATIAAANAASAASRTVNQNVTISNSYNGSTGYQKSAAGAAKTANQTYAKMARGLAYGS